jgi:SAM-dependent methyltransferase
MGLIFDANSMAKYEAWYRSPIGKLLEGLAEDSLRGLLDPRPGERVLDIGCGLGDHLIFLNKLGLNISGLDASPLMIERAQERLGFRCDLKVGPAEDLPFEDNEFDLAVLIHTLEFLDNPIMALKEAGRVARRGVFIGVLNKCSWSCLNYKFTGLFQKSLFSQAKFYSFWDLKYFICNAFGDVPVQWSSGQKRSSFYGRLGTLLLGSEKLRHCPFGLYLGLYVPLQPRMLTLQHPLKIDIKKAPQSAVNSITREKINLQAR